MPLLPVFKIGFMRKTPAKRIREFMSTSSSFQGEAFDLSYQKGAALLIQFNQEESKKILKFLSKDDVERLLFWIERIDEIPQVICDQAIQEFYAYSTKQQKVYSREWMENWRREVHHMHLNSTTPLHMENQNESDIFHILLNAEPLELAEFLHHQDTNMVALLLSYLEPHRAVKMMVEFPIEKLEDIIVAIAELQNMDSQSIQTIEKSLADKWGNLQKRNDPLIFLAECLALMPASLQHRLLEKLSVSDFSQFTHLREMLESIPNAT